MVVHAVQTKWHDEGSVVVVQTERPSGPVCARALISLLCTAMQAEYGRKEKRTLHCEAFQPYCEASNHSEASHASRT